MKSYLTIFILSSFVTLMFGQIPESAEEISPLLIGETFPDQSLITIDHTPKSLSTFWKEKPTVLIFFRGGWCPFCNQHLAELGQIEQQIGELGYQIIAISPETSGYLQASVDKNEIEYQLLSDLDLSLAKAVGIAFKAPDRYNDRLEERSEGMNQGLLPVPSVFVLDKEGKILFEYINPNYRERMSGELLLAVLQALK